MGFVHEAHDDFIVAGVFPGELAPETRKLLVRGSALTDDLSVPAGVIMDVDNAVGAGRQACLHQRVVFAAVCWVERTCLVVVDEVLPSDW